MTLPASQPASRPPSGQNRSLDEYIQIESDAASQPASQPATKRAPTGTTPLDKSALRSENNPGQGSKWFKRGTTTSLRTSEPRGIAFSRATPRRHIPEIIPDRDQCEPGLIPGPERARPEISGLSRNFAKLLEFQEFPEFPEISGIS